MIRAFFKLALRLRAVGAPLSVTILLLCLVPARAAMVADPAVLYRQMKDAYAKGDANGWNFRSQEIYLATIFNAGRAYSLQHPNDPAYGELATLTVQIGGGLHYNPLTNHDAAAWWVREAAEWVGRHSEDPVVVGLGQQLLLRANAEDDPQALARYADSDATANLANYPRDVDAQLQQVEANWRAWILTHDPAWRSLAFKRAAGPDFPVAHLPTTWGNEFVAAANSATGDDVTNARAFIARLNAVDPLRVIASVTAMPHDAYLSTLAPADEYFGKMGMSILGIENQLKRINYMLNYNYGNRESDATVLVADAIAAMHRIYPRDRDLPKLLYWCYTTLDRMTDEPSQREKARMRAILTVEYQDSPEARKLLSGAPPTPVEQ